LSVAADASWAQSAVSRLKLVLFPRKAGCGSLNDTTRIRRPTYRKQLGSEGMGERQLKMTRILILISILIAKRGAFSSSPLDRLLQ